MRTISLALLTALLFLLGQAGCSKEEKKTEAESTTTAATETPSPPQYNYDSLAAVRAPVRNQNNKFATLVTDYGSMTVELYRDVAPGHADSFVCRTEDGFYDSTIFFRVVDRFMIQGGDPTGTGMGRAEYTLNAEFSKLPHRKGTLSMARSMDPNSASCQFFICLDSNRMTANLDGKYTVFGHLIKGYDVLHKIGSVECMPNPSDPSEISRPKEDVCLMRVYVSDAEGSEI